MFERNWKELIKPSGIKVDNASLTECYGKFEAKPLERGFGTTLGNCLRRILLSSIQGAAITSIKVDGVLHEFSTIKNVKEDVMDLILNLKQVQFKMIDKSDAVLRLNETGDKKVTAGDIQTGTYVEVLNPKLHIATLHGGKLDVEISVSMGKGYVSSEVNKGDNDEVGVIAVDSFFSPIKKVRFDVLDARVGQVTDYDRLVLEVWTNGSVKPDDAVAFAAKILKEQVSIFINFDEVEDHPVDVKHSEDPNDQLFEKLNKPVTELELSVRSANCLKNANIAFVGELVQRTESDMLKTKNFGRKSLNEIKELIIDMGLGLGMKIDGWDAPENLPPTDFPDYE